MYSEPCTGLFRRFLFKYVGLFSDLYVSFGGRVHAFFSFCVSTAFMLSQHACGMTLSYVTRERESLCVWVWVWVDEDQGSLRVEKSLMASDYTDFLPPEKESVCVCACGYEWKKTGWVSESANLAVSQIMPPFQTILESDIYSDDSFWVSSFGEQVLCVVCVFNGDDLLCVDYFGCDKTLSVSHDLRSHVALLSLYHIYYVLSVCGFFFERWSYVVCGLFWARQDSFSVSKLAWPWEVGGWGRDPFSRNFMKPTPRRKWYLTTGRRFH